MITNQVQANDTWPTKRLGDCIAVNESTYSSKWDWGFVNYLDTSGITRNRISDIKTFVVGRDKIPTRAKRLVKPGDIVYSTVRPINRHHGIVSNPLPNLLASTGFAVIRAKPDIAATGFIYWFLVQDRVIERLQAIAEQNTSAYPSINPADIENLALRLPPIIEQRAIAHILNAFDDRIELNHRMNQTLAQIVRTLFKSWFVDFDPVRAKMDGRWESDKSLPGLPAELYHAFPDQLSKSELGEIPEGWETTTMGQLATISGGSTPSTKNNAYWDNGAHRWVTPRDLSTLSVPVLLDTERKITNAGLGRIGSGLQPPGTVLLSSRAPIGYLAINEVPTAINQGFIAMQPKGDIPNSFLLRWCEANLQEILNRANGSTFLEISKTNFGSIRLVKPSTAPLSAFARIASHLHRKVVANEQTSILLAAQRDALLPKLISGELSSLSR